MRTKHENATAFNDRSELAGHKSFVLVGIGGAGMSGVARMLCNRGFKVKGTDLTDSALIDGLRELGIEVQIGHTAEVVAEGDAVVFSDAIPLETSPEYQRARKLGCAVFRRSQCLGWMLEGKKTIAVTGTHGKTTVTGMIAAGLRAAALGPTIVVGAEVPQFAGRCRGRAALRFPVAHICPARLALNGGYLTIRPIVQERIGAISNALRVRNGRRVFFAVCGKNVRDHDLIGMTGAIGLSGARGEEFSECCFSLSEIARARRTLALPSTFVPPDEIVWFRVSGGLLEDEFRSLVSLCHSSPPNLLIRSSCLTHSLPANLNAFNRPV